MKPRIGGADERRALRRQLEAHPEATLEQHRELWVREEACAFRSPP